MSTGQLDVLMATYNGEKYLEQQLDSILAQTHKNFHIFVRDDGSTDQTRSVLTKYQVQQNVTVFNEGDNLGAAASFFQLLKHSRDDSDYFAFADQDDVWYEDKLSRAVYELNKISSDIPALYFSQVELVDEHNQFLALPKTPRKIGFGNALVENIATGCTVVINRSARNLLLQGLPTRCLMHDSWCYLVVSAFGHILYDPVPSMRYRQHANNAIGAATNPLSHLIKRIKRFKWSNTSTFRFSDQAQLFRTLHGKNLSQDKKLLLDDFIRARSSPSLRLSFFLSTSVWRQRILDDFILRTLMLLNKY